MTKTRVVAKRGEAVVRVRVRLADAPPRRFMNYDEIEGGFQREREVVPGEVGADGLPRFSCELRAFRDAATGAPVFLGPFAFGPPAGRFLYVSWSAAQAAGPGAGRAMFRRMKVPLGGITWAQVEQAISRSNTMLEAIVPGIAKDGGPACATERPRGGWRVVTE